MAELYELIEKQSELINSLVPMARAFEYCYKAFDDKWSEYIQEGDEIISDILSGKEVSLEKASEVLTKSKLIREVVCLMEETLKKYEEGVDEC